MATDLAAIERELLAFYPFAGRRVLHVGAGGGQFIGYARVAADVLAIDVDASAAERLAEAVARTPALAPVVTVRHADLLSVRERADVVLLEFCLHEMPDPAAALAHARTLADDVVVIDHFADSRWSWHCVEDGKVTRAWAAIAALRPRRFVRVEAVQAFPDVDALAQRVASQGPVAVERALALPPGPVEIPMPYALAWI